MNKGIKKKISYVFVRGHANLNYGTTNLHYPIPGKKKCWKASLISVEPTEYMISKSLTLYTPSSPAKTCKAENLC